jgi:hypothetical protein
MWKVPFLFIYIVNRYTVDIFIFICHRHRTIRDDIRFGFNGSSDEERIRFW